MKKIMFNDKYGLTQAVLEGRKTQTRRIIKFSDVDNVYVNEKSFPITNNRIEPYIIEKYSKYKLGEVVAVAQSYCSIADELENCNNATCAAHYEKNVQKASEYI